MYLEDKSLFVEPAAKPLDEIGQVLMKAADILRTGGWCQIHFNKRTGEHCMIGAIQEAANYTQPATDIAHRAVLMHGYGMCWNDRKGRTKEEVIAALEKVARSERKS